MVIFTDLDGTLLDRDTYSWEAAQPALERIAERGVPLIFCTSKTRAEVEFWTRQIGNQQPFVFENGGGVGLPASKQVLQLGESYEELVAALAAASSKSGVTVRGFHNMSAEDVAGACHLPLPLASLAKRREFDEPFEILDAEGAPRLLAAIEAQGKRWSRGGRFYHITGDNDKAKAARLVAALFPGARTFGFGDGMNDAAFLEAMDQPIVVRSPDAPELLKAVPRAQVTELPGPAGWNQAILELLNSH